MSEPEWTECKLRLGDLKPWPGNPAQIGKAQAARLEKSIKKWGQAITLAIDPDNVLIDGHQRLDVWLRAFGPDFVVKCLRAPFTPTEEEREELAVTFRSGAVGEYNADVISGWNAQKTISWGLDSEAVRGWKRNIVMVEALLESEQEEQGESRQTLAERFGVPPFSVLDARQGYWQERKRAWLALGIKSEIGRGGGVHSYSEAATISRQCGTIGFDGSKVYSGGVKMAMHNEPMQRKDRYDEAE